MMTKRRWRTIGWTGGADNFW